MRQHNIYDNTAAIESQQHLSEEKYLFSEEEINNISALVAVLKQIRKRLFVEGLDIDNYKKESEMPALLEK